MFLESLLLACSYPFNVDEGTEAETEVACSWCHPGSGALEAGNLPYFLPKKGTNTYGMPTIWYFMEHLPLIFLCII